MEQKRKPDATLQHNNLLRTNQMLNVADGKCHMLQRKMQHDSIDDITGNVIDMQSDARSIP